MRDFAKFCRMKLIRNSANQKKCLGSVEETIKRVERHLRYIHIEVLKEK
jgi:hypothetical protein